MDGLCNDCHGTAATNPRKAANALNLSIEEHAKAITAPSSTKDWPPPGATDYAYKCVDCHDPHGDANYYMVRSAVNNPTSASDTTMGS
ncbi:MAG: cytochrome c3 family protein, partial [Syntrophales bacterium]